MSIDGAIYATQTTQRLREVSVQSYPAVRSAAETLARVIIGNGVVHVFGTGHSRAFAMEMAGRAGGLVPFHAMSLEDLALRGGWAAERVLDPKLERDPEVAHALWQLYRVAPQDALIVVSNSGGNGATVEMAVLAREKGLPVIAVTSLVHSRQVTSRHPSGKRLFEVADLVIDNGAPYGDALLELPSQPDQPAAAICAISSLTGALIAQMLTAEIAGRLLASGEEVPVLISVNVTGGDEHNQRVRKRYEGRIDA